MDHVDEISAVIDDDVGAVFQHMADMGEILLLGGTIPGMHLHTVCYKGRSHIILCGERIGACDIHLGTACLQHFAKEGSLRF